jgi:hypothetical protein
MMPVSAARWNGLAEKVNRAADAPWFLAAGLCLTILLHIVASSHLITTSNQDRTRSDQGAEIWLARVTMHHGDLWPMRTDGVRHPLWSFLVRAVAVPDDHAFFQRGKWLNTFVACGFLILLACVGARSLGGLATLNVLLLSSLGILLVRGVYFQPEPLYYFFSFAAALCAWNILRGGAFWWFPAFGLIAGFAMLAKPSFEPMLAAFVLAAGLHAALSRNLGFSLRQAGGVALALAVSAVVLMPLSLQKMELFGSPTFSYPKIWMWMDDFESEAWPWQTQHPGKAQLETIPRGEIPSAGWYFRRHTFPDGLSRLSAGSAEVASRFLFPETRRSFGELFWKKDGVAKWEQPLTHRGIYLLVLAALPLALLAGSLRAILLREGWPAWIPPAAFACVSLAAYLALYGWYLPIGRGDRFMGSLWIPCVFLTAYLGRGALRFSQLPLRHLLYTSTHLVLLATLGLQALNLLVLLASGNVLTTRN